MPRASQQAAAAVRPDFWGPFARASQIIVNHSPVKSTGVQMLLLPPAACAEGPLTGISQTNTGKSGKTMGCLLLQAGQASH